MSVDDGQVGLSARGVTVHYGGVAANEDVSLSVQPGTVVGLIGPNGAGKTTFIDALTGFARYDGTVVVGGVPIDGKAPHVRRRAGLARTWQAGELFDSMTVLDNVLVPTIGGGWGTLIKDIFRRSRSDVAAAEAVLDALGIREMKGMRPSELPLGTQRLVGVARALAGSTSVVLLDEPAAGLDMHESAAFGDRLRDLAARGLAILLVDHDMNLVFSACDEVYVLDFGRVIARGDPASVREDAAVKNAYLGAATSVETG